MNRTIVSIILPWFLTGTLTIALCIAFLQLKNLIRGFITLPKVVGILLFCVVVVGAYIRFSWVPSTQRIYFDEDRYLMYAVSFAQTGRALAVQIGTSTEVLRGDPDPGARVTVPVIHAWVMKLFGFKDNNLFIAAKTASVIQIIGIFMLSYLLFGKPVAALMAALGLSLVPVSVFWSTTTNLDSYFVFFALASAIGAAWYVKKQTLLPAVFLFACLSLLLFVRIEGLLFLPAIIAIFITTRLGTKTPLIGKKDLFLLTLITPLILTRLFVALPLFTQAWCCAEATPLEIFQPQYFLRNTIPNLQAPFTRPEFPFMITILAFITLFDAFEGRKKWIMAVWILCYFFLYSFYYAGIFFSYTFSGSYGRFFLMLIPPLLILCGLSIDAWHTAFRKASYKKKTQLLGFALVILLTLYPTVMGYRQFIHLSPWDRMVDEGPRIVRNYLITDLLPNTPTPSVIIHPLTAEILMQGKSAVSLEAFLFQQQAVDFVTEQLKNGVPVYIFETGVCDSSPVKCNLVKNKFSFKPTAIGNSATTGIGVSQVELKEP